MQSQSNYRVASEWVTIVEVFLLRYDKYSSALSRQAGNGISESTLLFISTAH